MASVMKVLGDLNLVKPVFQQLGLQDLCTAAQVCQLWCEVANLDEFWKTISFQGKTVLPENAIALLRRHRATEELDLTGLTCKEGGEAPVECIRSLVRHVAPQLTNLRKLSFCATAHNVGSSCPMANQLVAQISSFHALTSLKLGSMRLSRGGGLMGQLAHIGLRELALDDSESSALTIRCFNLTHLSLSGASNTRLPDIVNAPSLVSLDISRCVKLLEASTRASLVQMTDLQQLSISGITSFLDQTVVQLATSLVSLTKLDMSRVSGITLQSVRGFPELLELDLTKCEQLNSSAVSSALESFEKLEKLTMDSCSLGTLTLSMPKLKSLSARGCHNLSEVEVRAWQLSHLDLGPAEGPYSAWVANSNLTKLSVTSGALRKFELVKLNKLSTIDLDCPTLTHITIRECDFTDPSVFQSLGDTALGPIVKSDVLSKARKSAPLLPKPPYQPGTSFTSVMFGAPGGAGGARLMDWMGPAEELADDDDLPMPGVFWGEDGDELPSENTYSGTSSDGNDDNDDDDSGGQPPGGMQMRAPAAAAATAGPQGGRGVGASRLGVGVSRGRGTRSRPVATWQAPDRLAPELVRFGGAVSRAAGSRAGPSGLLASVGGSGSGGQPPAGSAGPSSSTAAAAAAAAAAALAAATAAGGQPAGPVVPPSGGAHSLAAARLRMLCERPLGPGAPAGGAGAGGAAASAAAAAAGAGAGGFGPLGGDDDDAFGQQGPAAGAYGADAAAALRERERVRRFGARLERQQQERRSAVREAGEAFWQGPDQLPQELVRFGAAPGRPSASSSGGHASAGNAGAGSSQAAAAAAAAAAGPSVTASGAGARPSSGSAAAAAAAAAGPSAAAAAGPSSSAARAQAYDSAAADRFEDDGPSLVEMMESYIDEDFIWGASGDPLQALAAPAAAPAPQPSSARDELLDMVTLRRRTQRMREGGMLRASRVAGDGPAGSSSSSRPAAAAAQSGVQRRQAQQQQQQVQPLRLRMTRTTCAMPGGGWGGDSSDDDMGGPDDDRGYAAAATAGGVGPPRPPPGLRIGSGKGGVPRLRVLQVESCERVQELQLCHQGVEELVVTGCGGLVAVALHAPKLARLELQDLGDLKGVCLVEVAVPSLIMGSCSSLQGIELSSKTVMALDVRGCGGLQELHLDCPALQVLDANFCATLADEGLSAAVASIPPLRKLALSVCTQIGSTGLASLSQLTTLQDLDLSYTEVETLQPILKSCPHLQTLSIASCRGLSRDALLPLLDPNQPALAQLHSLDASYCDVQDDLIAQLLLKCRHLRHLALSGCSGVTDEIWRQVEGAQLQQLLSGAARVVAPAAAAAAAGCDEALMDLDDSSQEAGGATDVTPAAGSTDVCSSKLESLSLVRCNNLRSLCLGLLPASGEVQLLEPKHYLLAADRQALQAPAYASGSWVQVDSAVSELTSLKVGLSGLQVVALALPKLAHLDLSSCKQLRVLELRCPLLLQLQLQACTSLPVVSAVKGVLGAPHLQMLDVQHVMPYSRGTTPVSDRDSREDADAVAGAANGAAAGSEAQSGPLVGAVGVCKAAVGHGSSGSSLLAAVAADGALPAPVGMSTEVQIGMLLDEIAATHASLKSEGILRCLPVCKVCSKLAQCSL